MFRVSIDWGILEQSWNCIWSDSAIMENIFSTVKSFCVFSKCLGVFPLTLEEKSGKSNFEQKWWDTLPSLLFGSVTAITTVCILTYANSPASSSSLLSRAWVAILSFELATVLCCLVYQHLKLRNMPMFLKELHEFDSKVKQMLVETEFQFSFL